MRWGSAGTAFDPTGAGTNPFSVSGSVDPNSPLLPIQYATARGGIDGNMTIALTDGFSPPVTLIAWEWNRVAKKWFKLGPAAALYGTAIDATYAQNTFQVSENAIVLIQSSVAITGAAYTDGMIEPAKVGPLQEG